MTDFVGGDIPSPSAAPNPDSYIEMADGRTVPVKVHRCLWSGDYPENSLPAIAECVREGVARAEIDLQPLRDGDFLVAHDLTLDATTTGTGLATALTRREAEALRLRVADEVSTERPPLFSEVVDLLRTHPSPTLLELDTPSYYPITWAQAEELAGLLAPIKHRVFVNGYDWNTRRLRHVDPTLPVAYDLLPHLTWLPPGDPDEVLLGLPRGVYGYLDASPLARERHLPAAEYLADRLDVLSRLVPGAREVHVHLPTFEHMLADDVPVADVLHRSGLRFDVWTLDAGTPNWRDRLARVLDAGADVITSNTPRALVQASCSEG